MRPKKTIGRNARQTPFCRVAAIRGLMLQSASMATDWGRALVQIGVRRPLNDLLMRAPGCPANSAHARGGSRRSMKSSGRADPVEEACDFGFEILRPRRQPLRPAADFLNRRR